MSSIEHEVIGPYMVGLLGSEPDARAVIQPQPAAFRLLGWDFESFSPPDSLNSFRIHLPTLMSQQCRYAAVAIAAVLLG